jgi:hypothetical protein
MKDNSTKQSPPLSARMVEDETAETAETAKKRLRDMGLIVNAGVGKVPEQTGKKKVGK